MDSVRETLRRVAFAFPAALASLGIVDERKGEEAFDLAVPVMVTGGMRTLLRTADFFMVSLAFAGAGGAADNAVAGLELGFQYYFIPFGLSLALTSGTISVVSRFEGAGETARANLAVKQSLWLSLVMSVPITAATWLYAEPLIGLLTDEPATIRLGSTYLRIVMLSVAFRFWSLIAARALAGVGDTRTPMYVRLVTLPTNVTLNAVLIFGVGPIAAMGIAGAAWGTTIANTLAALIFFALLLSGRFSVRLPVRGPQFDLSIIAEIVRVSLPLAGTRLARTFGRFPFLFVLGLLGTPVLAAYAISRRVILLAMMPAWGYSTASSTLVGQHIGAGEDEAAAAYGWQTLRIALATQMLIAVGIVVLARPITVAFGTEHVQLTTDFIRVFGLGVAGFSISRVMRGGLRGAGDTTWPLFGTLAGTYLLKLPVAALAPAAGVLVLAVPPVSLPALPVVGTVALFSGVSFDPGLGFGLAAIYAAILGEIYLKAAVNTARFWSGEWKRIAHESNVGTGAD